MTDSEPKKSNSGQDFQGQRKGEVVVVVLQKHWFVLIWPFIKGGALILLALLLPSWGNVGFYIFNSGPLAFVYLVWIVFWASYIAYEYLNWYRDRFIITRERIINIDQKGIFTRRVSEIELDRIQDVSHEINGAAATAMGFGTVIIQSAGSENIALKDVARPAELQDVIVRLVKDATEDPPVTINELVDFIKDHRQ